MTSLRLVYSLSRKMESFFYKNAHVRQMKWKKFSSLHSDVKRVKAAIRLSNAVEIFLIFAEYINSDVVGAKASNYNATKLCKKKSFGIDGWDKKLVCHGAMRLKGDFWFVTYFAFRLH